MPVLQNHRTVDKSAIMADVAVLLGDGVPTEQIVDRLKLPITGRTLRNWITEDPSVSRARTQFFSERLIFWNERIETAKGKFPLARAREAFRSWAHLAGVRDPANFGPKQEITHNLPDGPLIQVNLSHSGDVQRTIEHSTRDYVKLSDASD